MNVNIFTFNKFLVALCVILILKAFIMLYVIQFAGIGLGPDEAQYWLWSRHLDWGYYSKPPGIAWQIALTTSFFGHTELGVRFGALLLGLAIPIATFMLARASSLESETAFWSGIIMAFSPLGILSSLFAITDGGMVFFWILASIIFVKAFNNRKSPNYAFLGSMVCCGALFKWPIFLFWLFVFAFVYRYPFLRHRQLFFGIVISLMGLLPSLIWNSQNHWVTFRHVFYTIKTPGVSHALPVHNQGNFWEFLGAQAVLLSPLIFILLLSAVFFLLKNRIENLSLAFLCTTFVVPLFFFAFLAIFKKIQGNWCDFIYPAGSVIVSWFCIEMSASYRKWLKMGMVFSVFLCMLGFSIPLLQSHGMTYVPYRLNPFKHNIGWGNLKDELKQIGYDPDQHFLFGDKYQISSLLSFYSEQQKRAYFLNLQGCRQNQFCFWPNLVDEQIGKNGFFVIVDNSPHLEKNKERVESVAENLSRYFKKIEFLEMKPLFYDQGVPVKGAFIFKCLQYNGQLPKDVEIY